MGHGDPGSGPTHWGEGARNGARFYAEGVGLLWIFAGDGVKYRHSQQISCGNFSSNRVTDTGLGEKEGTARCRANE